MANRPRVDDPDSKRGLYRKFTVTRHNPSDKHNDCFYFVLDLDHDEFALASLATYAEACAEKYPMLASDLRGIVAMQRIKQEGGNG